MFAPALSGNERAPASVGQVANDECGEAEPVQTGFAAAFWAPSTRGFRRPQVSYHFTLTDSMRSRASSR